MVCSSCSYIKNTNTEARNSVALVKILPQKTVANLSAVIIRCPPTPLYRQTWREDPQYIEGDIDPEIANS
jgi:hypothetical protein